MDENIEQFDESNQYIYLIREREFMRLNELTYKIGKTKLELNMLLIKYPPGSKIVAFIKVFDCDQAEHKLIDSFKQKFEHKPEYGKKYFEGDLTNMLNEITIECNELNQIYKSGQNRNQNRSIMAKTEINQNKPKLINVTSTDNVDVNKIYECEKNCNQNGSIFTDLNIKQNKPKSINTTFTDNGDVNKICEREKNCGQEESILTNDKINQSKAINVTYTNTEDDNNIHKCKTDNQDGLIVTTINKNEPKPIGVTSTKNVDKSDRKHVCKFCGGIFGKRQSVSRHRLNSCYLNPESKISKKKLQKNANRPKIYKCNIATKNCLLSETVEKPNIIIKINENDPPKTINNAYSIEENSMNNFLSSEKIADWEIEPKMSYEIVDCNKNLEIKSGHNSEILMLLTKMCEEQQESFRGLQKSFQELQNLNKNQ